MAEVLIFILGALFSLMVVGGVLFLLASVSMPFPADPAFSPATPQPRPMRPAAPHARRAPSGPSAPAPRQIASPARATAAEREAYRISAALDQAVGALSRIARGPESAPAKIAAQTLRRITSASEPPRARLSFARARLELLALGPEPHARAVACTALAAMT